jgi:N-acetyl-anhydromuramyl-L-alanine amidase AmpD
LENQYVNWIGDIYNGKPFERKWRDYFFWDKYTEEQINSLTILCRKITKEKRINKDLIGHNTKVRNVEMFEGIVTRSNFDSNITDLSPAFDFEKFRKKLDNE